MHRKALGKHGWSVSTGLLLCLYVGVPAHAAPAPLPVQVAIGSPTPNTLVGGRITLSIAYNAGTTQISAFTVFVDDNIQFSRNFMGMNRRGIQYLPLDTTTIPDGNHTLRIVAMGSRGTIGQDSVDITVKNGIAGGPDLVPPLVTFRGLQDGDTVSGIIDLDVLAEDNVSPNLLVSIWANQEARFIRNVPPYLVKLDTAKFLDPATNTGTLRLEAWAFDGANNLGKARPITINIRPAGAVNQTPAKGDPLSRPMPMPLIEPGDVHPVRVPMEAEIRIPLDPKGGMPMPNPGGQAVTTPTVTVPGDRPMGTKAVKNSAGPVDPEFAPVGSSASGLAGGKSALPVERRPREDAIRPDAGAPSLLHSGGASPSLAGSRNVTPAVPPRKVAQPAKPAPQRMASAAIRPSNPEVVPVKPSAAVPTVTPQVTPAKPNLTERPGITLTLPMPAPAPMPSASGARASTPNATRMAAVPSVKPSPALGGSGDPLVVMPTPGARVDKQGRQPLSVFRLRAAAPQDRSYRVHRGDTLESIGRKYKVTPRSLRVANAITNGEGLHVGSIIKVPGAFDVVVNNERVGFDVNPRVENGIPLAPFRQIFEHSGGVVVYYPERHEVRAANQDREIKLQIGKKEALVNQVVIVMEHEASVDSGRTLVPMSFMEKALDLKAEYDVKTHAIILSQR